MQWVDEDKLDYSVMDETTVNFDGSSLSLFVLLRISFSFRRWEVFEWIASVLCYTNQLVKTEHVTALPSMIFWLNRTLLAFTATLSYSYGLWVCSVHTAYTTLVNRLSKGYIKVRFSTPKI